MPKLVASLNLISCEDLMRIGFVQAALVLTCLMLSDVSLAQHPNVVIIYGDDVGWGDVGAYGSKLIPTPNIDQLAASGLQFNDAHCSAATCTPSRFSLLTGIHGFRHNVRILAPNAPMTIKPEMLTLPQLFQNAGYETGIVGKWHLGIGDGKTRVDWNAEVKPGPLEVGFGYSFLLPSTNDRVPCVYLENHHVVDLDPKDPLFVGNKPEGVEATEYPDGKTNRDAMTYYESSHGHNNSVINGIGRIGYQWGGKSALWNDEGMADVFVEKTKAFIARQTADKPFFLYFSSQDIHVPRTPHPRFQGKTGLGYRGDAMVQLDWSTGEIMKSLEENGFAENTIVIFSSDNGPVYDDGYRDGTVVRTSTEEVDQGHDGSGPFRGGKYQIFEGGTRVPFIVRWPGKVKPGQSNALFNQIDLLASFASLLDVELEEDQAIDSRNTLAALLGETAEGIPFMLEEAGTIAVRQGPWKFISPQKRKGQKAGPGRLFDLDEDPGEQRNLAQSNPELVKEMSELLQRLKAPEGIRKSSFADQHDDGN
jgi:arylsulfatase A-like enzyme